MIIIYTLPHCPNCEEVKRRFIEAGKDFVTRDMSDPASIAEMRVNGYFGVEAPIIQIEDSFYGFEEFLDK